MGGGETWEGATRGRRHIYTYGPFTLKYGKSHHNLVNIPQLKIKCNFFKKRRGDEDTDTQREGCSRTQEKLTVCQLSRESPEEAHPDGTLIVDFQPPEL